MPVEQPSWQTSTTSQVLVASILFYGMGAAILMWKGTISTLEPLQWLINILLPLYAVRRGGEMVKNGNGGVHGTPEAPASGTPPAITP